MLEVLEGRAGAWELDNPVRIEEQREGKREKERETGGEQFKEKMKERREQIESVGVEIEGGKEMGHLCQTKFVSARRKW